MTESEETTFVEGEDGGEDRGYRIPMNLRVDVKEEGASEEGPLDEGKEGIADEGLEDEGAKASEEVEEVDIDKSSIVTLGESDLDALIDQEKLGVDKGLSKEEKLEAVAKALGFELADESKEGLEGKETVETLRDENLDLKRQLGMLSPAQDLMLNLEGNPQGTLEQLARHYGVDMGPKAPAEALRDLKVEVPQIEPGPNEDMPTYLGRVVAQGIQSIIPQVVERVAATMGAQAGPTGVGGAGKEDGDPRVVRAIQYLDKHHPEWPQVQGKIMDLLKINPLLVNDPETLYMRASGRKSTRGAAGAKKVKLKRVGATGERGGRKPVGGVPKKLLDPNKGADFKTAWNQAKRTAERKG